jgi:L-amino acid N-acyltransferase YncA
MRVRPAEDGDLPALVRIYNRAIEHTLATFDVEPFTVDDRRAWFAQFGFEYPLLVCEDRSGAVAGFAYYLPYRRKPAYAATMELSVYVDDGRRRRGAGSSLYAELLNRARAAGVHALIAVIAGDNPASDALHRRFGFQRVGVLPEVGRKFGRWVDTAFWHKILADPAS